mmetsp:Transcript_34592/g.47941  ORF Transcript_34592/g.47941 Transcript_34592/m.47941 type:complete len:313 (+) Transcript_34592:310-1248(+)
MKREPDIQVCVKVNDKEDLQVGMFTDVHSAGPGGRLWDGCILMAQHLAERQHSGGLAGRRVLEIGAGLGLPGIVAASRGADVTFTDKARCLALLEENARENGVADRVTVQELQWGRNVRHLKPPFDLVILSDCICHDENAVFRPLLKTLVDVSGPLTEVLISYKRRSSTEDIFWELAEQVFDIRLVEYQEVPELDLDGDGLPTFLYRCTLLPPQEHSEEVCLKESEVANENPTLPSSPSPQRQKVGEPSERGILKERSVKSKEVPAMYLLEEAEAIEEDNWSHCASEETLQGHKRQKIERSAKGGIKNGERK